MAISTMYPAMPGSPKTALAADITADATSITVTDGSALPTGPNLAVIGDDSSAEVVSYTTKSSNTLSGVVRGLGGTTAAAWTAGTEVARNFTSLDHDRFKENIEDLATNKLDAVNWGDIGGDLADQTDLQNALNAKQNALTFDDNPTSASSNPVKSSGIYDAFAKEILYFTNQATSVTSAASAEYCRITDSRITADTVVLNCEFTVPSAITSDVSWESASGYISLKGICTSTNCKVNIALGQKGN